MTKTKIYIFFLLIFMSSCLKYDVLPEGGVRLKNSNKFKYNKKKFGPECRIGISINSIYLIDSSFNKWNDVKVIKRRDEFIRFFPDGQVLFIDTDGVPDAKTVNNKNIGIPGYYIIEGDKIKIEMFQNLNGGQLGKYFGKIINQEQIIFYNQRPETYLINTFKQLEKYGSKSFYSRQTIKGFEDYKPDW